MKNFRKIFLFVFVCGLTAISSGEQVRKILRGRKAEKGQFPWMVRLLNTERGSLCGASIISPLHLITAAHCLLNNSINGLTGVKNLVALTGIIGDGNNIPGSHKSEIESIHHHPKLNLRTSFHEIAILKLTKPLVWTTSVKPIRFGNESDKKNLVGEEMVAVGWGNTDIYGPLGTISPDLKFATLIGTSCNGENYGEDTFCARGRNGENVCSGDSGGPIVCKDATGEDYLCGYSSKSHCERGFGIFGRVNYYADFIRKTLNEKPRRFHFLQNRKI